MWSYVSGIYNFLCSPCVVNSHPTHDEVYSIQHYYVIKFVSEICDRFSPGTTVSSTNKTDHHDIHITEILLKMALNTLTLTHINIYFKFLYCYNNNMKQAHLKIICRFHAHPVHQNSVDIFGPRYMYVGDDFF